MTTGIVFHLLGIGLDVYEFGIGAVKVSELVSGVSPHSAAGFVYYLVKRPVLAAVASVRTATP